MKMLDGCLKHFFFLVMLYFVLLIFSAAASPQVMEIDVVADKSKYCQGEEIHITVIAKNNGSSPITLVFPTSCTADYTIDGYYRWSDDKMFLQVITYAYIEPYGSRNWYFSHRSDDYHLSAGIHTIIGEVVGYGYGEPVYIAVVNSPTPSPSIIPTPIPTPSVGGRIGFHGYVKNKLTQEPLRKAEVNCSLIDPCCYDCTSSFTSDSYGSYGVSCSDVGGIFKLMVKHSGYIPIMYFDYVEGGNAFINVNFELYPAPSTSRYSGDYNGDGCSDIALYNNLSGRWAIRSISRFYFGTTCDLPASGDYDGDGTTDPTIFRNNTGLWGVRGLSRFYFGAQGDLSVPGDYNGDGTPGAAVFRQSSGLWALRGISRVYFGKEGDIPIPLAYNPSSACDIGIFRDSTGLWAVRGQTRFYFGGENDLPVPGDYDGDGSMDYALFRPASGLWAVRNLTRIYFGQLTDWTVPADYAGNGTASVGIFRGSTGLWAIRGLTRTYFGGSDDVPVTR